MARKRTPTILEDLRPVDMDNLQSVVDDEVALYAADLGIDEKDIDARQWNDVLDTIQRHLFGKKKKLLKVDGGQYGQYDGNKVMEAYRIYKRICNRHSKTISLTGFEYFTGIEHQTLYNWDTDCSYKRDDLTGLNGAPLDFRKVIMRDNEESLQALLESGRGNPVGTLARLNRYHNWNVPGIRNDQEERKALPASALPRLDGEKN